MSQLSAEAGEGGAESEEKKAKRARHLELTNELTRDMLPVLLAVYSTSAGPGVRHSCIQVGKPFVLSHLDEFTKVSLDIVRYRCIFILLYI